MKNVYLVTFLIIYFAALERVTILNAVYLMFLTVFMAYPPLLEKGWVLLVVYCELAIVVEHVEQENPP